MVSCGYSKMFYKYRDELSPKIENEFIRQGVCRLKSDCDGVVAFEAYLKHLYIYVYVPKDFEYFDYSAVFDIVNNVYVRDNINITVTIYEHGKWKRSKRKKFKVRYYSL